MFDPPAESGAKLCNMKPMNYSAAVVYLRNDSPTPQVIRHSGPKNFSLFQRSMASGSPIYDEKR